MVCTNAGIPKFFATSISFGWADKTCAYNSINYLICYCEIQPSHRGLTSAGFSLRSNPPQGTIKVVCNVFSQKKKKKVICNAVIGNSWSYVAIVFWDWRGTLVFAFSIRVETIHPYPSRSRGN